MKIAVNPFVHILNKKNNISISSTYIPFIDSLKGLGLLGVILTHVGGVELPNLLGKTVTAGKYGVQLLFLISGYLAYASYKKQFEYGTENNLRNNLLWIRGKMFRLIPLYAIALVIYSTVAIIESGSLAVVGISACDVITHLLFIHGCFPHYINSIIPGGWYLGTLVLMYLLIPLIYRISDSLEKIICLWITTAILSCLISNILINLTSNLPDAGVYSDYFGRFWIVTQLPVILTGILAYYIVSTGIQDRILHRKSFALALLLASVCLLAGLILEVDRIKGISDITLYAVAFLLVFISQYISPFILLDNPVFRFIGRHSYPIYLFHVLMIWIVNALTRNSAQQGPIWLLFRYITVVGLTCGLSALIEIAQSRLQLHKPHI